MDPWLKTADTDIQIGESVFTMLHPANSDDLISEADYVKDERLPYWADIWPSSRVLAGELIREQNGAGKSLLELGCGIGLVSLAARLAGFSVVATDYYEPALEFCAHNVRRNKGGELHTLHWNWRDAFPSEDKFDFIVASDILYERDYGSLIADILRARLKPGGNALVADPGRIAANDFLIHCERLNLNLVGHHRVPITDAGRDQVVDIYRFASDDPAT